MARKKEQTFEEALSQLEQIVSEIEGGEMPLADLMAKYSEGIKLSDFCVKSLKRAEETMDLLVTETADGVREEELRIGG
ncbi:MULTISPECIES: exodeoxyribonuclease VII small subunit [Selenomonas]|jgi:exonuclease VII small subunit|uniref:Exodeoxyribonuclease 7 small subunit n=1 Tax=Selenomonas artemidis F0399 TaxID=749551 RepID=E7MZX3_9FIRM|nr:MULTISPECIES: exodeoxyribonuclease VII small subunit [Selenomonas]EFR40239.1 exodeoxyribonuclease VII, small subunit [Selenomonas sp. oral taxon 137 str. F0430]EFW30637.1 exodeoxyribonuclease VII, small subunit [Selenomonas artemidis F0399]